MQYGLLVQLKRTSDNNFTPQWHRAFSFFNRVRQFLLRRHNTDMVADQSFRQINEVQQRK